MLDFGGFGRCFAYLLVRWPPGVPPDPKQCENVSIFSSKTDIFQVKKAGIPFCFLNIFGERTDDTVPKNGSNTIFPGEKGEHFVLFFVMLGKNTAGTVHKKRPASRPVFKHLWGENRRHSTTKQVGGYFPVEKGEHAVLFFCIFLMRKPGGTVLKRGQHFVMFFKHFG